MREWHAVLPSVQLGHLHTSTDTQQPVYNDRRFNHTYVIGKTGMGKSTALIRWAIDDILAGEGIAFFDPHGSAIKDILLHIPPERHKDVVLYDPSDRAFPVGFNILDQVPEDRKSFVASSVVDIFKSQWAHSWGPQLEQFLYNGIAALLDVQDGTLLGLKFLLTSQTYRTRVIGQARDPIIKDFWAADFEELMPEKEQRERTLSTLNKIGALVADPTIRNSIGQPHNALDLNGIMERRKILLVALPQGELGIEKSSLIGSLILSALHLTALQRKPNAPPFHVYLDEAHHFGPGTIIQMLSGIRKFRVSLVCAHQYMHQLPDELREAFLGTVGTIVAFRLGTTDARLLEPELHLSETMDYHLHELPPYTAYARNGETHHLAMRPTEAREYPDAPTMIRTLSRRRYATQRKHVERRIATFVERT